MWKSANPLTCKSFGAIRAYTKPLCLQIWADVHGAVWASGFVAKAVCYQHGCWVIKALPGKPVFTRRIRIQLCPLALHWILLRLTQVSGISVANVVLYIFGHSVVVAGILRLHHTLRGCSGICHVHIGRITITVGETVRPRLMCRSLLCCSRRRSLGRRAGISEPRRGIRCGLPLLRPQRRQPILVHQHRVRWSRHGTVGQFQCTAPVHNMGRAPNHIVAADICS